LPPTARKLAPGPCNGALSAVPRIGAQIQIKGGLARGGLPYTDAVEAKAVQVFVGNPRGWKLTAGDPAQDALFTAGCAERGIPSFIHTPYLVNVGSPTEATVDQSITSIAHNLRRGAELGCSGVVVHAGSAVGEDRYEAALRQLHERLLPVLDTIPDDGPRLLIEPTAGGGKRWPPRSRTSARTSRPWRTTRSSVSASTPATPGRPVTTSRWRAA